MKKLLHTIALLLFPTISSADSGVKFYRYYATEIDGIYYFFNSSDKTASVSYKYKEEGIQITEDWGEEHEFSIPPTWFSDYSGDVVIPKEVVYDDETYSVTSIGEIAFINCSGLTSITIPNSVTTIGNSSFSGCSGLNSVTIGNSVTSIDDYAFSGCSGLTSIVSQISNPFEINENVFPSSIYSTATLSVPFGTKSVYEATNGWKNFKNIVEVPSPKRAIHVATAGTLQNLISVEEIYKIEDLTLTGEINGDDLRLIRNMAGRGDYYQDDDKHESTSGKLAYIDLSEVKIKAGGCYYTSYLGDEKVPFHFYLENDNEIPTNVFCNCNNLISIIIPNSVTSIRYGAFSGTTWLKSQPDGLVYAGKVAYCYKGKMPVNTSIILKDDTKGIADYAFSGCSGLTSVTIPNSVTHIGERAFNYCSGLGFITIPNSVKYIGSEAFSSCSSLGYITIPNNVESIGSVAFWGCSGLTSIKVESGNQYYDSRNNCNAIIETNTNTLVAGCKNTIIPNSVTSIGYSAFYNCSGLTSITIPNSVASIGNYAFYGCSGLTSVTIPNSVTSIGWMAFYCCSGLTKVISNIEKPFKISSDVFYSISSDAELFVPQGTKSLYESTEGWKNFKNIVEVPSPKRAIHVATAGTLPTLISEEEKYEIEELTLSGELNGTDFKFIREMAGDSVYARRIDSYCSEVCHRSTRGVLKSLDISNAKIISGGEYYNYYVWYDYYGGYSTIDDHITTGLFTDTHLETIILPNNVVSISLGHSYEYRDRHDDLRNGYIGVFPESLTSITIPNSVSSIGDFASFLSLSVFYGCSSLTSIKVDSGNKKYDSRNNCNAIIETSTNTLVAGCKNTTIPQNVTSIGMHAFSGCSGLSSINIPNSVTSIGQYAFSRCTGLTSINIPNSVTSIDGYVFSGCSGLTSIKIPNSVTSIGQYAFSSCSSLTSINIPNSVTSIGYDAFSECSGLAKVISKIENPFAITSNVFYNIPSDAQLFVPHGAKSLYETTEGWKNFKNIKEIIEGDVNFDEKVNTNDKDALVSYILGESADNVEYMYDVNGDGKVDVADVVALVALIDSKSSQGLSTDSQIYFDEVDGSQVVSSLICTLNNERDEEIVLTKCELYCNQKMVSYKNYSASSGSLAAGGFKSCSFDNLTKLNSKSGFSVRWHYTSNGETYVYRCTLTE